jgi:hypothetical protein
MAQGLGRRAGISRAPRRLVLAAVLAAVAMLSPAVAFAAFRGTSAAAMTAGSLTLAAPAPVSLSGTCPSGNGGGGGSSGSVKVTFPNVSRATSYDVVLDPPLGSNVTKTTTSGPTGVTFTLTRTGTYTVTVTAGVQSWDSAPTTRTFTC